jgi:hypothetical protein
MATATQELQSFYQFAEQRLRNGGSDLTLDDLFGEWRACNPMTEELQTNVLAVRAALRDLDAGEKGQPIEEFLAEFERRNGI